ncbi:TrbC family F-type conjugative pilus assembly protein [Paenirhodobacter populi]|uniref:TrbC family F-type conjugative pilus assembly protein n=1 Tax=Paenirhodobacter populi TaxID=2306993 RepID=UPI0013E3FC14|nr:TrbC family F-type conjugative pilus assembly protein [Sinirhodobacter populi]
MAQQYNLTYDDVTPRGSMNFALPSQQDLTNPPGYESYLDMAREIGRTSTERAMRDMQAAGMLMGVPAIADQAKELEAAPGLAVLPAGYRASILVSAAMGEGALKDLLALYKMRKDVRIIFRGVPAGWTVPEFAMWLKELSGPSEDGGEITDLNITLDPEFFAAVGAFMAPTTIIEDLRAPSASGQETEASTGRIVIRAEGYSDVDMLFGQSEAGETDVRGPNVVEIAEEDLRQRAEREAAASLSRLTRDPEVIKKRYWDRQRQDLTLMPILAATANRIRQLHFVARTKDDITDHNGQVLAHAGEIFMPDQVVAFDRRILVFNPNSEREVAFVEEALKSPREGVNRVILIATQIPSTQPGQEPWDGIQALVDKFRLPVFLLNDTFREAFKIEMTPTEIYPIQQGSRTDVLSEETAL